MDDADELARAWQRWAADTYRAILPLPVARLIARSGVWPDVTTRRGVWPDATKGR